MSAVRSGRYIRPDQDMQDQARPIKIDRPTVLTCQRFGQF